MDQALAKFKQLLYSKHCPTVEQMTEESLFEERIIKSLKLETRSFAKVTKEWSRTSEVVETASY